MTGSLLDTLLDRTVVPGYTRIGYRLRSRGWDAELSRMDGKTVLVTGATSGLGLEAAASLARLGAGVRVVARNPGRAELARARIATACPDADLAAYACDVSSLAEVRELATRIAEREGRLDVLVNNAGALLGKPALSVDGVELTFATNVLGPFLLTKLLIPLLESSAPARIVNVSSGGMYTQRIDVEDLRSPGTRFDGAAVYARTKRAQVILTEMWAERLRGSGIAVHAMHPGWAQTPGVESSLPRFHTVMRPLLRTASEGADTIVWLACAEEPGLSSGGFWHDRQRRPTHVLPWTKETAGERRRLWQECGRLSAEPDSHGIAAGEPGSQGAASTRSRRVAG